MVAAVKLESFLSEARLRATLGTNPDDPAVLRELIGLCLLKGEMEEGVALSQRLVAAAPDDAEAHRLHQALLTGGPIPGGPPQHLPTPSPNSVEALLELGRQAEERQDWGAALAAFLPCAERDMSNERAMTGLINALARLQRHSDAARVLAGLCAQQWNGLTERFLAMAELMNQGQRLEDGAAFARAAMELLPQNPAVVFAHARSLINTGRPREGLRVIDRAVEMGLAPDPSIHTSRSAALHLLGQLEDALAEVEHALAMEPDNGPAVSNRALMLMALGRWKDGLPLYERRPNLAGFPDPDRRWNGEEMEGTLLICGEQGLGDQVQCLRYIPIIRPRVRGRLVVQLADPLLRLARESVAGVDEWLGLTAPLCPYDRIIPMMSLMQVLDGGAPGTVPVPVPFLRPPSACSVPLPEGPGLKVGLCWAGGPGFMQDYIRSMPAAEIGRLVRRFPDIRFYRLQRGPAGQHVGEIAPDLPLEDAVGACTDYADTAAVIDRLDLVITVDTSLAHVAAALGKETWILIPHVACFRWGQTGDRSPLYPSVRLIRRRNFEEGWGEVMDEVARRLERRRIPE